MLPVGRGKSCRRAALFCLLITAVTGTIVILGVCAGGFALTPANRVVALFTARAGLRANESRVYHFCTGAEWVSRAGMDGRRRDRAGK